jgi:integrase
MEIHQLRHAHATDLINSGVSIEAVRRRLGHASTETTQLYANQGSGIASGGRDTRSLPRKSADVEARCRATPQSSDLVLRTIKLI